VQVVEALEEEQVGDLLDDFQRVGDAAGPEGVPEGVDFGADFAGEHESPIGVAVTRRFVTSKGGGGKGNGGIGVVWGAFMIYSGHDRPKNSLARVDPSCRHGGNRDDRLPAGFV
jgi:hypothetical protein